MKRWLFLLLFLPVIAFGQFRMVSSTVTLDSTVNDSTYIVYVDFFSDQTAKGYFASGITADYRVFSQTGQLYDITAASNLTLSSGELTIVEIDNNYVNTESAPVGQILVFDPQGDYITFTPFGNSNMGQVLQQAIGTYNAVVSSNNEGGLSTWSDSETYIVNDQIKYDGRIYTNKTGTNTTTPPDEDVTNWEITNQSAILSGIDGRDTISQASHGFSVGDPLWYSGDFILARDTGESVRVDGIVVEVIDANNFVRQRSGKFTLSSHGFTNDIQLYIQPDGSYSTADISNSLIYGYAVNANEIQIGLKETSLLNIIQPRSFEFSRKNLESITRAKSGKKTWVVSDTVSISGNLYVSDLDIIFEKNGFISGADTITANGATIQANSSQQLWSKSTAISGDWNIKSSYLRWTVGSDFADSVANFRALTNAVALGECVYVYDSLTIATTTANTVFNSPKNICIKGIGNDAKINLATKHNTGYGYFRNDVGFNLEIDNIEVPTIDHLNATVNQDRYTLFISSYNASIQPDAKPSSERINVTDCKFKGNITLLLMTASNANQTEAEFQTATLGFSKFKGITVDSSNRRLIDINQMGYGNFVFEQSNITDIGRTVVWLAQAGLPTNYYNIRANNCKTFNAESNTIRNTSIVDWNSTSVTAEYTGFAVVENGRIYARNNTCEDILVKAPNELFEAMFIYPSDSELLTLENNVVKNVMIDTRSDPNGLLRLKECTNIRVLNNEFALTLQALMDLGVIDSLTHDLTTISADNFALQLFAKGFFDSGGSMVVKGNTFRTPFLNHPTPLTQLDIDISDNIFQIGYLSNDIDYAPGVSCALFHYYDDDDNYTGGASSTVQTEIHLDNKYIIDSTACSRVMIDATDATATGSNNDYVIKYTNIAEVTTRDTFSIGLAELQSETSEIVVNTNKSGGFYTRPSYTLGDIPILSRQMSFSGKIGKLSGQQDGGIFTFRQKGNAILEIESVEHDTLSLVVYGRNQILYSEMIDDTIPAISTIRVEAIDSSDNVIIKTFQLAAIDLVNPANSYNAFYALNSSLSLTRQNYTSADPVGIRVYASTGDTSLYPHADIVSRQIDIPTNDFRFNHFRIVGIERFKSLKVYINNEIELLEGVGLAAKLISLQGRIQRQKQYVVGGHFRSSVHFDDYGENSSNTLSSLGKAIGTYPYPVFVSDGTITNESSIPASDISALPDSLNTLHWEHKFPSNGDTILLESHATRLHLGPGDVVYIDESPLTRGALLSIVQSSGMSTVLKADGASNRFYQAGQNSNSLKTYGVGSVKTIIYNSNTNHWYIYNDYKEDVTLFTDYATYQDTIAPYPNELIRYDALASAGTTVIITDNLLPYQKFYMEIVNGDSNAVTLDHPTGGFIRGSTNGDFDPDATEAFNSSYDSIILFWDGTDFTIKE